MSDTGFTPKQLKAIELLARPDNELDLQQIADELGINQSTLWRWRRDENFQKAVTELSYSCLKDELPKVFKSLASKAIGGNVKAMELMLKYAGNYVEKIETKVSGDLDLGGVSDAELDRQIKEQERLLKLAEGKE
jgi:transcriptional regulator with XRE-family HTH domain